METKNPSVLALLLRAAAWHDFCASWAPSERCSSAARARKPGKFDDLHTGEPKLPKTAVHTLRPPRVGGLWAVHAVRLSGIERADGAARVRWLGRTNAGHDEPGAPPRGLANDGRSRAHLGGARRRRAASFRRGRPARTRVSLARCELSPRSSSTRASPRAARARPRLRRTRTDRSATCPRSPARA